MSQYSDIVSEIARQYDALADAILISPSALAHRTFETFATGDESATIQYASLEHIKHLARVYLAKQKGHESDENPVYQGELDLGITFSGLQDRYPMPKAQGEEPVYKLRAHLTSDEREWNVKQLEKSGFARLKHAEALRAEGQLGAA